MAENPKVPTRKRCELGETDPNQELKGEVRWVVRKVTEGAENRKDPRTGMERRTQRGRKLKAASRRR